VAKNIGCPTEQTLDLISGRWKALVIYWLLKGDRRFNQLQRDLSGITHRTLTKQLRELEADGLVERHDFGENPPRVAYRLSDVRSNPSCSRCMSGRLPIRRPSKHSDAREAVGGPNLWLRPPVRR
jgi:DNA-binding HxlR family transcriptional regulator